MNVLAQILNQRGVALPTAIHRHDCPCWRIGKKHGPCNCGGRETDDALKAELVALGVNPEKLKLEYDTYD
jgi:hypothetical protein